MLRMKQRCLYILWILLLQTAVWGQTGLWQNLRSRIVLPDSDTIQLDTLSIIPNSLEIREVVSRELLNPSTFQVHGRLLFWNKRPEQTVIITYRVFPFDFKQPVQRLDTANIKNEEGLLALDYNPFEKETPNRPILKDYNTTGALQEESLLVIVRI